MSGAGTGMVLFQLTLSQPAPRLALTVAYVAVVGATTASSARLVTRPASTARTTATAAVASALFAPRSNPIWVQKEGASLASGAAVAGEAAWLEHSFCKK